MNKQELLKWIDGELEAEKRLDGYTIVSQYREGWWSALRKVKEKINEEKT